MVHVRTCTHAIVVLQHEIACQELSCDRGHNVCKEGQARSRPGRPLASTAAVTPLRVARRGSKPGARGRAGSVPHELPAAPAARPPCKRHTLLGLTHMSNYLMDF